MGRILDLLMVAGTAVLSVRLLTTGLHRRYRVFFYYLIFATLHLGVLANLHQHSNVYQKIWVLTEPIDWLFSVLIVLEIYALVLADYRGLATVGRWALITAVGLALAASAISLLVPSQVSQSQLMRYYYVAERAIYFSLCVFLITILGFLVQYPVTLRRNIITHSMVFSVYFLGGSVSVLVDEHVRVSHFGTGEPCFDGSGTGGDRGMAAAFNPAGEVRKVSLRPQWMPGQEQELVSQLNSLNAALLRPPEITP